jgi:hypothetical protein
MSPINHHGCPKNMPARIATTAKCVQMTDAAFAWVVILATASATNIKKVIENPTR